MSSASFEFAFQAVLRHEGGFVDHPLDPGGATKLGITQRTLALFRGRAVSVEDVRGLSAPEARTIYRRQYWDSVQADELPPGIDLAVFDIAVNSGPGKAARLLQRAVGAAMDGVIGPKTIAATRQENVESLIRELTRARLGFLSRLATWRVFGRGWKKRVLSVEADALRLFHASSI
ncbi:glycoside hydrolase family 108 protein [Microvirga flavescens]|uniref:glycoside hydrolase family 108 protein n=1 Tax=Microvirga flavescens TaxID=2249811 RepID=UPI000DDC10FD|nr:glycosyl hydrolase 108 family protein [Microvirga flavescens]